MVSWVRFPDAEPKQLGAVVGYGCVWQTQCLEGFDSLGLHQIYTSLVLTAAWRSPKPLVGVRIPRGVPIFAALADVVIAPGWSPEEVGSIPTGGTKKQLTTTAKGCIINFLNKRWMTWNEVNSKCRPETPYGPGWHYKENVVRHPLAKLCWRSIRLLPGKTEFDSLSKDQLGQTPNRLRYQTFNLAAYIARVGSIPTWLTIFDKIELLV